MAGEIIFQGCSEGGLLLQGMPHLAGFSDAQVAALLQEINSKRPDEMIISTRSSMVERFIMAVMVKRK